MKKFFVSLVVAALCGLPFASAQCADAVRVSLQDNLKPADVVAERMGLPASSTSLFSQKDLKVGKDGGGRSWYMVRVPLQVRAKSGDDAPLFVDALDVTIYTVFMGGKDKDKPLLLSKTIKYVEVPLDPSADPKRGTVVNVGVLVSPMNVARICGKDVKSPSLEGRLGAVAVEASFQGSSCTSTSEEPALVISRDLKKTLSGSWWKKSGGNPSGAVLSSMAESPFAPFYSPMFPATSPLYAAGEAPASTSTGDSTSSDSGTITPDTTSDEVEEEKSTKKKKSRGKKKRSK